MSITRFAELAIFEKILDQKIPSLEEIYIWEY